MSRRRQTTPWIHQWSRPVTAGIAAIGVVETTYLTATKLLGGEAACPTEGCTQVLSSPYATILGLPLTLFGFLAYSFMLIMAISPFFIDPDQQKERRRQAEKRTAFILFIGAVTMVVFSSYLMYVMAFEIQAVCLYCITSATLTLSLFLLTLFGHPWEDRGQLVFTGLLVGIIALTGTFVLYAPIHTQPTTAASSTAGKTGPAITTSSGESEMALGRHLKSIGAKFYGAYWCPHCHDQKQLFGKEAMEEVPYIECAEDGASSQTALCKTTPGITGFPSWEIKGEFYAGTQPLEKLADISGYQGPRNFQN